VVRTLAGLGLGLGKYEAAFRENDIDETVLPSLRSAIGAAVNPSTLILKLSNEKAVTGRRG
jgi:hypothetical protein